MAGLFTDREKEILIQSIEAYIKAMQHLENARSEEEGRALLEKIKSAPGPVELEPEELPF